VLEDFQEKAMIDRGTTVAVSFVGDGRQTGGAYGVGAQNGEIEARAAAGIGTVSEVLVTVAVIVSAVTGVSVATSAFPFPVVFDKPLIGIGCGVA